MAQHKGDALHNGLDGEEHAGGRLGAFTHGSHKISICHVVDIGDQHGDGGGDAQPENQLGNRRLGHFDVVLIRIGHKQDLLSL